jgi:hypothetical protein
MWAALPIELGGDKICVTGGLDLLILPVNTAAVSGNHVIIPLQLILDIQRYLSYFDTYVFTHLGHARSLQHASFWLAPDAAV